MTATSTVRRLDQEFEVISALDQKFAQVARRLRGLDTQNAFWKEPRGLELRSVRFDESHGDFVITFRAGNEYWFPASALKLAVPVRKATLDEFKHGVVVHLADGTETSFASDLVLFECEPAYRTSHLPLQPAKESNFGAHIRTLRISAGLQAKQVAAAAGLAASNYARLEASKHQPRIETLVRVAKALGVSLANLVSVAEK